MADFKRHEIGWPFPTAGTVSFSTFTLNATTDAWELIFKAPTTDPITRVGFRVSALNGTATTWKASLQGVDASNGQPDGAVKGGGSPASVTFTNSGMSANTWVWKTLANSYTPTRGEDLAIVVAYESGTSPSAGVNDLTLTTTNASGFSSVNPYTITNDAGSRTKVTSHAVFGVGTATTAYGCPMGGAYSGSASSSTNPNELAMRFLLPSGGGTTYKVVGARLNLLPAAAGTHSLILRLYDGTTVLQDVTIDNEVVSSAANRIMTAYFDEASLTALNYGSEYRLAIAPQTTTAIGWRGHTVTVADDMAAFAGGTDFFLSTRNGGAWTDDPTARPHGALIVEDITATGGGGVNRALLPAGLSALG